MEIIPLHLHIYIIFLFGRGTVLVGKSKEGLLKSFYTSKNCQNCVKVQEKLSRTMALKPAPHLIFIPFQDLTYCQEDGNTKSSTPLS